MRLANVAGRLTLVVGGYGADVALLSDGRFGPDPQSVYDAWPAFRAWADGLGDVPRDACAALDLAPLLAPVPRPRQVFAIGLNYRAHAAETGAAVPDEPVVFTKFPSCITGPYDDVVVPAGTLDWEAELVVVIGRRAVDVPLDEAWSHVAGVTVGQDLSERIRQRSGPAPQWSLAKSLPGFGPTGPWLVTPDELADPDDLEIGCSVNGVVMQKSRTSDMVFSVPDLVSWLSRSVPLYPGDLVFTGTPSGVALGRPDTPWLKAGDELVTWVEGLGELRQRFVAGAVDQRT
jgi:2-keto-4-pentenoate hydratase/2-oxohepta-3-ene-1,7-dioic acid hydratase in catechol pathway